jgi:hypothetical protein
MRNKAILAGMLAALALAFVVTGCSTTDITTNETGLYNLAPIAVKDYEILGAVNLEAKEVYTKGLFGWTESTTGNKVTFGLLLEEAKKQYPNTTDIINVRIDKLDRNSRNKVLDNIVGYTATYVYTGTALAVRYTTAITGASSQIGSTLPQGSSFGGDAAGGLFGLLGISF